MSLKFDHKIYSTEVSSHFEIYLSDLFCVMTYCLVFSRRVGGHVINVVEVWPQDLEDWDEVALWNLSCCPPPCDDLLSCLFTKTGRPRDKWSLTYDQKIYTTEVRSHIEAVLRLSDTYTKGVGFSGQFVRYKLCLAVYKWQKKPNNLAESWKFPMR